MVCSARARLSVSRVHLVLTHMRISAPTFRFCNTEQGHDFGYLTLSHIFIAKGIVGSCSSEGSLCWGSICKTLHKKPKWRCEIESSHFIARPRHVLRCGYNVRGNLIGFEWQGILETFKHNSSTHR
jgi:hypothetical protein